MENRWFVNLKKNYQLQQKKKLLLIIVEQMVKVAWHNFTILQEFYTHLTKTWNLKQSQYPELQRKFQYILEDKLFTQISSSVFQYRAEQGEWDFAWSMYIWQARDHQDGYQNWNRGHCCSSNLKITENISEKNRWIQYKVFWDTIKEAGWMWKKLWKRLIAEVGVGWGEGKTQFMSLL